VGGCVARTRESLRQSVGPSHLVKGHDGERHRYPGFGVELEDEQSKQDNFGEHSLERTTAHFVRNECGERQQVNTGKKGDRRALSVEFGDGKAEGDRAQAEECTS